jgi:hypothetical protein
MFIARTRNIQVATADIIDRFIINQESTVRVLNGAVGRENSVVRLNDGSGNARGRVDSKF